MYLWQQISSKEPFGVFNLVWSTYQVGLTKQEPCYRRENRAMPL